MDYNGKSHYLMDDLGVPPFQETSKYDQSMDWFKGNCYRETIDVPTKYGGFHKWKIPINPLIVIY
jgi:hypothetical protein